MKPDQPIIDGLAPNKVLRRLPEIRLHVDSMNMIQIEKPDGGAVRCGSRGLAVLDAFYQPASVAQAMDRLKPLVRGAQDWMDLTGTMVRLYREGVLRDENETERRFSGRDTGLDAPPIHILMLNDRARTSGFIGAIEKVVRPGDVVVDLGTGSGILAMAAARAGASRVYAIEGSGIGRWARAIFEANGLTDRITLLEGWSTQIELPERADVLVSEIIGNEPLAEQVLEVTLDARSRLMKQEARVVPRRLKLLALPVSVPPIEMMRHAFTAESVQKWRLWYGFDFSPFGGDRSRLHQFFINTYAAREWPTVSEPALLADIDLGSIRELQIKSRVEVTASKGGSVNGVLLYFELELAPSALLSTHPANATTSNSWRSPVWFSLEPSSLQPGDALSISYAYRVPGMENGIAFTQA